MWAKPPMKSAMSVSVTTTNDRRTVSADLLSADIVPDVDGAEHLSNRDTAESVFLAPSAFSVVGASIFG